MRQRRRSHQGVGGCAKVRTSCGFPRSVDLLSHRVPPPAAYRCAGRPQACALRYGPVQAPIKTWAALARKSTPSACDTGLTQFSGALLDGLPIDELLEDRPLARDGGDIHPEGAAQARKERDDQQAARYQRITETYEKRRRQGQPQGNAEEPRCQTPTFQRRAFAGQQALQREDHLAFSFLMIHGCPGFDTKSWFGAQMK